MAVEYLPNQMSAYLGARLADERRKMNLTQVELANRTGIDQAVISRVECGRGNPTVSLLQALAQPLGLHVALVPNSSCDNKDTCER